jgi:hypothetical protein
MICEKCDQEIKLLQCEGCRQEIHDLGPFCYLCGHRLGTLLNSQNGCQESSSDENDNPDFIDFTTRLLCSDGACIGVIGENGACKVCGKPYIPEP